MSIIVGLYSMHVRPRGIGTLENGAKPHAYSLSGMFSSFSLALYVTTKYECFCPPLASIIL